MRLGGVFAGVAEMPQRACVKARNHVKLPFGRALADKHEVSKLFLKRDWIDSEAAAATARVKIDEISPHALRATRYRVKLQFRRLDASLPMHFLKMFAQRLPIALRR